MNSKQNATICISLRRVRPPVYQIEKKKDDKIRGMRNVDDVRESMEDGFFLKRNSLKDIHLLEGP